MFNHNCYKLFSTKKNKIINNKINKNKYTQVNRYCFFFSFFGFISHNTILHWIFNINLKKKGRKRYTLKYRYYVYYFTFITFYIYLHITITVYIYLYITFITVYSVDIVYEIHTRSWNMMFLLLLWCFSSSVRVWSCSLSHVLCSVWDGHEAQDRTFCYRYYYHLINKPREVKPTSTLPRTRVRTVQDTSLAKFLSASIIVMQTFSQDVRL